MPTPIQSSDYRWAGPAMRPSVVPPNNRFERSRGRVFGESRRGSMIGTKQLRLSSAQPHVAQPDR